MPANSKIPGQLERALAEKNWNRTVWLARELLFGEAGMSAPNSPVAIEALGSAYRAGYRIAGYELARVPFDVVGRLLPISEAEWLGLLVENARSGDVGAILDVEHLPERLISRREAEEIAQQGRGVSRNVVDFR